MGIGALEFNRGISSRLFVTVFAMGTYTIFMVLSKVPHFD